MKIKWFLRGLGVGIIGTALLLCIVYRTTQKGNHVIQQAKELGMVFPETETADVTEIANNLAEQVQKEAAAPEPVSEAGIRAESEEDKKAKEKLEQSKENISNASAYHGQKNTFVVRSGLLSSSVAREMEEQGIIDSADKFDDYLEKNGYGRMVRSGKYKIPVGADYETIAKIITRQD